MKVLKLNYDTYPLVVGSADKYEFEDWENCGSSIELKAFYLDENLQMESAEVSFQSSNPENVYVSETGIARALRTGFSQITAMDGEGNKAYCDIVVIDNYNRTTVQSMRLSGESLLLSVGEKFQLTAEIFPRDYFDNGALNTKIQWSSDDTEIVEIDKQGVVNAKKEGTVKITARTMDVGRTAHCIVRVQNDEKRGWLEKNEDYTGFTSVGNPYLYNVHICSETVTANSLNILWNRLSWIDLGQKCRYEIRYRERIAGDEAYQKRQTEMLGYTIEHLKPETEYEIRVAALSESGEELGVEDLCVRTAEQEKLRINVCEFPYCATGDGVTMDTRAIQRAINECPIGGTVYLPAHKVFLSGALFLKSNITFMVDGILLGSTYAYDYPRIISRWEGWRKEDVPAEEWKNSSLQYPENTRVHSSLINLGVYEEGVPGENNWPINIKNVIICGKGQINANGFKLAYTEGPNHHVGNGGQPVPASPIANPNTRGCAIQMKNARSIYVKDLVIAYAPWWTVHSVFSEKISFDHLKIVTMGTGSIAEGGRIRMLNGDGINPDSSKWVTIFRCDFTTGDDAIAVKSGRNREGNELQRPCSHIRITDCYFHDCLHGIALGSEIAAGVSDLLVQNIKADQMMYHSFWIKTMVARGGVTHDIVVRDCEFDGMVHGINVEFGIPGKQHGLLINPSLYPAEIRDLLFENIEIRNAQEAAIHIRGVSESPVKNVILRQVVNSGGSGKRIAVECGENIKEIEISQMNKQFEAEL